MYYNPHFFKVLTQAEITFVVAHEVLHCVYDHMTPMQEGWDKRLFNISADYIINMDLSKTGVGEMPAVGLLDWQYDGWNSFEVYNHLKELKDKGELPPELQTLDVHIMIDDDGNVEVTDGGEGDGEEGEGKGDKPGKGKPKLSKEEKQQIANEIKEAMINAAQNAGAGDVPAGIKRMIDQLTAPKLKWQELVNANIESCVRNNYTFMRPTRRGWHSDAIMPGMERDQEIDVCICMDMSGSITNEQGMGFISEIHGMMQQFAQYKLRIWTFDTEVYGYDEFTSDDGREITEYELLGGGGTDFMCNWKYMKENDIEPQQLIMFTDGMPFGDWGDPNYCDTLFVIHSHYDKTLEAPFGRTVHFED
jgi:predicted metal-dependent peptidase